MTQEQYLNPPTFSTGDVLSASKLNHLLTDIDTLYGWYHSPWYGCDKQQYDSTQTWTEVEGWAGWVVLHGDTLNVRVTTFVGNVYAHVWIDDVWLTEFAPLTAAGNYVLPLSDAINDNGWGPWSPHRIKVITHRPDGTGELDVVRVYLSNSTVPAAGTMPTFTDGETSAAADFNAVSDGIRNIAPVFMMPVAGCRGGEQYKVQDTNLGWTTVQDWSIQHRLNRIRASLFIQGGSVGTISARLMYEGVAVNGALWTVGAYQGLRITDQLFAIPGTPTIGTFYNLYLQVRQSVGYQGDWFVRPDYVYEDQEGLAAGYETLNRWTHGDYAAGVEGTPNLLAMATNLEALDTNVPRTVEWVNIAQREPITTPTLPLVFNFHRRFYHVRRWRWLAYSMHEWTNTNPATGDPIDAPSATVNWTYDGVTWQSYTLPDDEGAGAYYDMDTSPIAPGMVFYCSGVKYAIQTPYTY